MVKTGLDIFLQNTNKYKDRKIALIVNQTSVNQNLQYSWDLLQQAGLQIKTIFSPEHGLFATEQEMVAITNQPDFNCNIVSLYKDSYESLIPKDAQLNDIDLVIFDIQDIGARYYTYVNTMALFMKAIEDKDIEMLILDRPNPLGGKYIEGPLLDEDFYSFVGVFPIAIKHGLTPAELALLYKDIEKIDINLSIIKMEGWNRTMNFDDTELPWIPPSPNMPTVKTAVVYPGMCLFEGLNISEGRGTTTPFEVFGAPFINPNQLKKQLEDSKLEGVIFRPMYVKPTFNKFSGKVIGGLYIHVTDVQKFKPFLTAVALTQAIYNLHRDKFKFLKGVYEFNDKHPAFDLLAGSDVIRKMIFNNEKLSEIEATWKNDEREFLDLKKKYHLYE